MVLTGERRSCRRKPCPSATSSNTNLTFADVGSNQGLSVELPATDPVNHGTAFVDYNISLLCIRIQVVTHRERGYMFYLHPKNQSVNTVWWGGGGCLLQESYRTHKYTTWEK